MPLAEKLILHKLSDGLISLQTNVPPMTRNDDELLKLFGAQLITKDTEDVPSVIESILQDREIPRQLWSRVNGYLDDFYQLKL